MRTIIRLALLFLFTTPAWADNIDPYFYWLSKPVEGVGLLTHNSIIVSPTAPWELTNNPLANPMIFRAGPSCCDTAPAPSISSSVDTSTGKSGLFGTVRAVYDDWTAGNGIDWPTGKYNIGWDFIYMGHTDVSMQGVSTILSSLAGTINSLNYEYNSAANNSNTGAGLAWKVLKSQLPDLTLAPPPISLIRMPGYREGPLYESTFLMKGQGYTFDGITTHPPLAEVSLADLIANTCPPGFTNCQHLLTPGGAAALRALWASTAGGLYNQLAISWERLGQSGPLTKLNDPGFVSSFGIDPNALSAAGYLFSFAPVPTGLIGEPPVGNVIIGPITDPDDPPPPGFEPGPFTSFSVEGYTDAAGVYRWTTPEPTTVLLLGSGLLLLAYRRTKMEGR